jgi:hypothetical protein
VTLFRTDVSEEFVSSIIRVERVSKLGRALAVTRSRVNANVVPGSLILPTLMIEVIHCSETSFLTNHMGHIPEYGILHGFTKFRINFLPPPKKNCGDLLCGHNICHFDELGVGRSSGRHNSDEDIQLFGGLLK